MAGGPRQQGLAINDAKIKHSAHSLGAPSKPVSFTAAAGPDVCGFGLSMGIGAGVGAFVDLPRNGTSEGKASVHPSNLTYLDRHILGLHRLVTVLLRLR